MKNISYLQPGRAIKYGLSCLTLLLGHLTAGFAQTTYYVSASGNDANSGRSADAPFQTLAKVSSLSLQPGDAILLNRGDTFRGTLFVHQSGSADRPIIIDGYGSGNKPVIAGSVPVSNWTSIGNNSWQANCPACGSQVTGVYQNAAALPLGRYPNLSDPNKGYLTVQSHGGKTQLTSQQGLSTNWTGGEVVVRSTRWIMDRAPITQQGGNTLTLNNTSIYDLADGWGFFIQNHPATLDQTGEWYYNPATKTIQLYDSQNNPNNQSITATAFNEGINLTNVSFVTVRNIQITQTLTTGLYTNNSSNLTVSGNDITNSGTDGVFIGGSGSNVLAENNSIQDANNSGLIVQAYQNFTARGNTIQRIGVVPGRGKSGDGNYTGLQSSCVTNTLIENNVLNNIGYNGISFVNDAIVRNNQVTNFCATKSDGGGIYTWNGNRNNVSGLRILSNIIANGVGGLEGTPGGSHAGANGIFLDDCSQNVDVANNTVFGTQGIGIFLRGALSINLKGNTSYNNSEEQLMLAYNNSCPLRNNTIQNNILFSRLAAQTVVSYESNANDLNQYGQFDYNYYVRPFEDKFKIRAVYNPGSGLTGADNTLAEWQAKWGQDRNSFNSPITYKTQAVSQTGASLLNQSFVDNTNGWSSYSTYNNGRLDWDNTNRLDGGSMQLSFASASNQGNSELLAFINIGAVAKGKTYQLLFDGVASGDGKRVEIYPRQLSANYQDLASRAAYVLSAGRQAYDATFTATADESNAILIVRVQEDGKTVWLDNIRLQEATVTTLNPDDYIKLVYNPTLQDKVEPLNGTYRDVKNTAYTNQITVPPFSSVVLLKETGQTPPPAVALRDPENPANAVTGLDYQYYEGSWNTLPDFNTVTPVRTGTATSIDLSVQNRDTQFGLRYKGYINIPTDGTYTFYTASDDGSKFYVGTTEVVSNDGAHGTTEKSGTIGLKAGKHAITTVYIQGGGGKELSASYSGPGVSKQVIPSSALFRVGNTTTLPITTPAPTGAGVYLSDLTWSSAISGYGPVERDHSNGDNGSGDGRTITLNGVTYAKGLGVHAASEIVYNLGGQYTTFISDIGIDDEMSDGLCGSVEFEVYVDNVLAYSSGTMINTTPTRSINLNVPGKQMLKLVVKPGSDNCGDHGDWAGARLIPVDVPTQPTPVATNTTYLSDMAWSSATSGYGPVERDRSNGDNGSGDGRTITLNGVTYAKGLGAHAPSEIVYNLSGKYTTFISDIGIDDEMTDNLCGSVTFEVYLDNVLAYSSGTMVNTTPTRSINLNVSGKQTLKLVLNPGSDNCGDHGDWAGARLIGNGNARLAAVADENAEATTTLQVYPVPARETIWVRYYAPVAGEVAVQLHNTAALPVSLESQSVVQGENLIRIPVRSMTRGLYFLTLSQNQYRMTRKILLAE